MKKLLIFLMLSVLLTDTKAQVYSVFFAGKDAFGQYTMLRTGSIQSLETKRMPSFDLEKLLREDNENKGLSDIPFRFGYGFDVDYTLNDGVWEIYADNNIWSLKVSSEGAYSLNFIFEELFLSKDAQLFIFGTDGSMVYGPVTKEQNISPGQNFLSDIIAGNEVVIQLIEPVASVEKSSLKINKVVHGYVNMFASLTDGINAVQSLSCNNDVVCYPTWNNESNAVALVLLPDGYVCSGSLLNNTSQDFRQYFLSAFHCADLDNTRTLSATEKTSTQNWAFRFKYEKTTCNGSTSAGYVIYNGADFRAAWNNTDFLLMELKGATVAGLTFLGWDRTGNNPTVGTCIHHPSGDVMKISFDNNTITSNSNTINWAGSGYSYSSPANTHWVAGLDNGTVERGSSGAPLYNQNKLVVGQLHGGSEGCPPVTAYFGQFHKSWTGGGTNDTRLSNWLAPVNSGTTTLSTLLTTTISGTSLVCSGNATFTVSNAPAGYTWGYNSSMLTLVSTSGNTATFSKNSNKGESVSVSVLLGGVTVATKSIFMGGVPDMSSIPIYVGCEGSYRYGQISLSLRYGVDEFEWRGTNVTIEPYPSGYIDIPGDRVRLTGYPGNIEVRARNACGWSEWKWGPYISDPCN